MRSCLRQILRSGGTARNEPQAEGWLCLSLQQSRIQNQQGREGDSHESARQLPNPVLCVE